MQSIPVCAVTAWSGTGKTTFLEKLVPALKMFGLRIAVVKHDGHDFDLDHPGKDSWRMTAAGADVTAIVSPFRAAIMENRSISMESVISNNQDVDLILIEGDKQGNWPKLLLYRKGAGRPLAADPEECLLVVSDTPISTARPCFALDDFDGIAGFLSEWAIRQRAI